MEFRGVPERARRAERQIVWIWHLNTHGVNLGRDTLGNDIRKAGLFGDPAKGTLHSSLISMENVYPTAQKSGLVILSFSLISSLIDRQNASWISHRIGQFPS